MKLLLWTWFDDRHEIAGKGYCYFVRLKVVFPVKQKKISCQDKAQKLLRN